MGTVKASGSLSLEEDVLTKLPASAPSDGSHNVGSVAVSMSAFRIGAGGLPGSGAISFSDFYNVSNEYAVANFAYTYAVNRSTAVKDGNRNTGFCQSATVTGRVGYRFGNRSTSTAYTNCEMTSSSDTKGNVTWTATNVAASRSTNTLIAHYSTYS